MVDYKTIVSTTDSKVTLMQWLQSLAKEFGNAKITDIAFNNDGNSSLTFTFTLADGSTKTASCKAFTLTDDEKTIVSGLVGQVTTSSEGITFSKAVTFAGNIVTKGNEIHNGYASFLGDESHAGTELHKGQSTFTDLRTDDITSTDGQDLLSYDGTNTALKGKGTRPLYNDGEMALLSDISGVPMSTLIASFGSNYYMGKKKYVPEDTGKCFSDALCKNFTNYSYLMCGMEAYEASKNTIATRTLDFSNDFFNTAGCKYRWTFSNIPNVCEIQLPSLHSTDSFAMFHRSSFTKISVAEGCTVKIDNNLSSGFTSMTNLTEIGAFDLSSVASLSNAFNGDVKLKSIHCTGMKVSFNISESTAFEEADLVEILNNLATVSTTQTLTMGSTNLAKLTSDEILIATGKGWALN